ncbi:MAG TPA: hypothetical protein VH558_02030 [Pseudolabrys sp.]|jgi:hypothetical protein
MAKRKQIEGTGSEMEPDPDSALPPDQTELPLLESPSVSPAKAEMTSDLPEPEAALMIAATPDTAAESETEKDATANAASKFAAWPRVKLRPRHRRYGLLAASVVIAASVGAVVGATISTGFSKRASVNIVGLEESKAAQQSIARLSNEITSLKANLEAANKSAQSQFAKISDRLARERDDITGSLTRPQTVPPSQHAAAPLPPSRPAPIAAAPHRPAIITGWTIRETRDGFVYVQGRGDIYQVVPGAPLPGLGPVEQIKRQDGRWVVVTPKGIIVSMRDRRYFE